ncbi:MAG TPA: glycoside hydrolase family 88 protein [Chitinophagaceae bacterium]|jgi:rhamnogalacturonyl hydrolase YesR|nr:glycoside hydrolase family 88 protein [Chitinophagaceae bacterium]
MRKVLILFVSFFILSAANSQKLPADKKILATLRLTNRYFMKKWPDAGKTILTNIERPSNIWTRAVYYEGLMALYKVDKQQSYYDYALQWGERHQWGLRGGMKTRNADNQCCGQTYIDMYLLDNKQHPERVKDIKASIDSMLLTSKIDDWNWIDALQMAMPVFVKLGRLYDEPKYFDRMYEMYAFTKNKHGDNGLYNQQEHLWWRDKDFDPPYKEPNGNDCYWARGNGWVLAALARVLTELPKTELHYQEYLKDYKDMCAALLPLQRSDGYWNVSLHDPNNFGGKEVSGTSLFIYGFAWGINNNILNKKIYLPAITKAWNAMSKEAVHPDGKLGYVQGTGKEPKDGQPVTYENTPDFEDYGLGCFLLAGTEIYKMK